MGSGKSTVGPLLAQALGLGFDDLDDLVEAESGCSVSELFERRGQSAFRELEAQLATRRLTTAEAGVFALGGGTFVSDDVRRAAAGFGWLTVYLRVRPDEALRRLGPSGVSRRPLLAESSDPSRELRERFEARDPVYLGCDVVIETDRLGPGEVAAELARFAQAAEAR
jgi:shikimate kinase